jgi:hypothetical protein
MKTLIPFYSYYERAQVFAFLLVVSAVIALLMDPIA